MSVAAARGVVFTWPPAVAACFGAGSLADTPSSRRIELRLCLRGLATG